MNYKNVGYLGAEFQYFLQEFAQAVDQKMNDMDQDRPRRALSIALFIFFLAYFQNGEKSEKLLTNTPKMQHSFVKPVEIRPGSGPKKERCGPRENSTSSIECTPFQLLSVIGTLPKLLINSKNLVFLCKNL